MGKKPFPKRPPGEARSLITKFEHTAGRELERVGGKKRRRKPQEIKVEPIESVLYLAPPSESPVMMSVKTEMHPSLGERFMLGLRRLVHGERAG